VALTEGVVNPKILTWKGRSKKAPLTPPEAPRKEIKKATKGGIKIEVVTPETGKVMIKEDSNTF